MVKPNEVLAKAKKFEEQNYKFRVFLKIRADHKKLDKQFLKLHKEFFTDYDCCKCANCCKMCDIILDHDEVKRITAFLGLAESDFIASYLANADADDEKPYKIKTKPCLFLQDDGHCRIQDCKPDVCVGFPYTDRPNRLSSMYSIIFSAEICPIVFEILERLKMMYGFRNRRN